MSLKLLKSVICDCSGRCFIFNPSKYAKPEQLLIYQKVYGRMSFSHIMTTHDTAQKLKFPVRIYLVNVIKSAVS